MSIENKRRSHTKVISWRCLATLATMLIVFALTSNIKLTLLAGFLDIIVKSVLFYGHEYTWNKVKWGRAKIKPFVLWFTGLSGAGKSTLADAFAKELEKFNVHFERLDGDVLRQFFPNTGFSKEDRNMHIRRVGLLASMLEKNGVPVICSFISPYRDSRQFVREQTRNFVEIHVNASLNICEQRDPKGLYKKARAGEIKQFTGIDDPYEIPENPELNLNTEKDSVQNCVGCIFNHLKDKGLLF